MFSFINNIFKKKSTFDLSWPLLGRKVGDTVELPYIHHTSYNSSASNIDSNQLISILRILNLPCSVRGISTGPVTTTFTLDPINGTRISLLPTRTIDIAVRLGVESVQIDGNRITISNPNRSIVNFTDCTYELYNKALASPLPYIIGTDTDGKVRIGDLTQAPHTLIAGSTGAGKCLAPGTLVLMYDGRTLPVEKVKKGDLVMGPDSTPRKVLGTTKGVGPLFKINPVKGESWICNNQHVLTLVNSSTNEIIDIEVQDYLNLNIHKKHLLKLYQPEHIDFPAISTTLPVDPYFLGIWLGDGNKNLHGVTITKPNIEIKNACIDEANRFGLSVTIISNSSGCPGYRIQNPIRTNCPINGRHTNPLLNSLRVLMNNGIRIPQQYLLNSKKIRLQILAGLLDTDGHLSKGYFEIAQKNPQLADDIEFLARSLGLRVTRVVKRVNNQPYHRLCILGNVDKIPTRIPRKQAQPRKQIKNALRTGFTVEAIPAGQYYGFQLSGDGRFLLGDFTVTHNSCFANNIIASILATRDPTHVRFVMIDPKRVEYAQYQNLWHLLHPVIDEIPVAINILKGLCEIMEDRYKFLSKAGFQSVEQWNSVKCPSLSGMTQQQLNDRIYPIVVFIDEYADLVMQDKNAATLVTRLGQKARAAGIHLVLCTQHPLAKIISTAITTNFPTRIAFQVQTASASRVILDTSGAENLLRKGDMIYQDATESFRAQGPFVTPELTNHLVNHWKR